MTATQTPLPMPTPGFEFPTSAADQIDARLRTAFADRNAEPQQQQSVRPERQKRPVQTDPESVTPAKAPHTDMTKLHSTQIPRNTIINSQPPTTPMTEPEAVSIDLPSKFAFYSFKDLYVRPFRVSHLAKIAKASANSSLQMVAEVVSSVLSTPDGDTNIAFQLTMADFTAVLYWLRFNSFTKKTMQVEFTCGDDQHIAKVNAGEMSPSSLKVVASAASSMLDTHVLEFAPDPEYFRIAMPNGESIGMRPETIRDVIEFLDHPQWQDEEFQYLAKLGALLNIPGMNLSQRSEFAGSQLSTDDTVIVQEFAVLADAYGIDEYVQLRCPECGASQRIKISVDASRFLSPKF